MDKLRKFNFEDVKQIKPIICFIYAFDQSDSNFLYRKYGVLLHIFFFVNWTTVSLEALF